jgi:hypothetical protein
MYRAITRILVPPTLAVSVLAGCAIQDPTYPPTTGADLGAPGPRTVEYSNGKYQLYGDGSSASPYYWVWIPAGTSPPSPPPLPPGRVAAAAPVTEGRYQLYGDGSSSSPYYWVWVPAGTTVVPPPPPPRRP